MYILFPYRYEGECRVDVWGSNYNAILRKFLASSFLVACTFFQRMCFNFLK